MAAFKVGQRVKLPQPDLLTEKQEGEVAQIAGDLAWVKMNDYVSVPCPLDELEPADPPADDEVTRLRAENARLRAALAVFADSGTGWIMDDDHMRKAADALKGDE